MAFEETRGRSSRAGYRLLSTLAGALARSTTTWCTALARSFNASSIELNCSSRREGRASPGAARCAPAVLALRPAFGFSSSASVRPFAKRAGRKLAGGCPSCAASSPHAASAGSIFPSRDGRVNSGSDSRRLHSTRARLASLAERSLMAGQSPRRMVQERVECPEQAGEALDAWAYQHGVELHVVRPGHPIGSVSVDTFNGRFRGECQFLATPG